MNDNDYDMQVDDLNKAEEIKYEENKSENFIFVYGKSINHSFFFGYFTMSVNTNLVE